MMINNRKSNNSDFGMKMVQILVFFCVIFSLLNVSGATSCVLSNRQVGKCKPLRDCRSVILSLRRGSEPEYCNYEQESVCCVEGDELESVRPSSRSPKQQNHYQQPRDLYPTISDVYESNYDSERDRQSLRRTNRPEVTRISNNDQEELTVHENTPNYGKEQDYQPEQPDDLSSRQNGYHEGNHFVPPGLTKKKPWNGEKTTESSFYYEYVSKKPGWGQQGNKGPNKHNNNGNPFQGNNQQQPFQRPTKRPERPVPNTMYQYEWQMGQNQNVHNNFNQWTTTTRRINKWTQETTTVRNEAFGTGGSLNWPQRPSVQSNHNVPLRPQEGSRPQGSRPNTEHGRQRKSELKCHEYSKEVTENITGLPLTIDPSPVVIPVRKCVQAQQLIVGGENTTLGEFPHMAAIGFRDRNKQGIAWNCGGTLISEQFVLTAAHCTSTSLGRPVKVRLGEYNLKKNDDGAYPVDYGISEIITYPEYKPPSKYHDIALLKLSRKVKFYKHIRPACLYLDDTLTTTKAIATGWGRMFYDGNVSEVLQKVVLNIVDKSTCNRLYKVNVKTEVLSRGIVDSQLCAGELSGGKDTCQGDSGGPLSITNTKCIHHIIGITSFGKSCALPNSTGVYTKVSAYVPWIESIVWPDEQQP